MMTDKDKRAADYKRDLAVAQAAYDRAAALCVVPATVTTSTLLSETRRTGSFTFSIQLPQPNEPHYGIRIRSDSATITTSLKINPEEFSTSLPLPSGFDVALSADAKLYTTVTRYDGTGTGTKHGAVWKMDDHDEREALVMILWRHDKYTDDNLAAWVVVRRRPDSAYAPECLMELRSDLRVMRDGLVQRNSAAMGPSNASALCAMDRPYTECVIEVAAHA